jgi:hypothetical protein
MRISFVVVSVCWGSTGPDGKPLSRGEVPAPMRAFARGLVDVAGADVVHGHGTPFFLGVEVYKGKPILYSCGVLLSDRLVSEGTGAEQHLQQRRMQQQQRSGHAAATNAGGPPRPELRPDIGMFATVVIRETGELGWVELKPMHCRMLQVNRASGRHWQWAVQTMGALCRELGTKAKPSRAGLRIGLSMQPPSESAQPRGAGVRGAGSRTAPLRGASESSGDAGGRGGVKAPRPDPPPPLPSHWPGWLSTLIAAVFGDPRLARRRAQIGEAANDDTRDAPMGTAAVNGAASMVSPLPLQVAAGSDDEGDEYVFNTGDSGAGVWSPKRNCGSGITQRSSPGVRRTGRLSSPKESPVAQRGWMGSPHSSSQSPGVRRGGRLGSPGGSNSARKSLWGWAQPSASLSPDAASASAEEELFDTADHSSDDEESIPLSVLVQSLNGGK